MLKMFIVRKLKKGKVLPLFWSELGSCWVIASLCRSISQKGKDFVEDGAPVVSWSLQKDMEAGVFNCNENSKGFFST